MKRAFRFAVVLAVAGLVSSLPAATYTHVVRPGAVVHATDILELRTAANEMRAAAGLAAFAFTDASLTGQQVRAIHVAELRTAIDAARAALAMPAVSYTDPTIAVGSPGTELEFAL